jgi:hypothetical protein
MRVGVSITKSTTFRGAAQEFSNTYYYNSPAVGPPTPGQADNIIDALVTKEKAIHGTSVNFVRARAWSAGGTKAENTQLAQKLLTGTGTAGAAPASMDRERAFLVRFKAGQDTKGRPVYLRKWFHLLVSVQGGESITDAQLGNTAQLTNNMRSSLVSAGDNFKTITTSSGTPATWDLVSEKGRPIDGPTQAHPYLEHHQLGDMWR